MSWAWTFLQSSLHFYTFIGCRATFHVHFTFLSWVLDTRYTVYIIVYNVPNTYKFALVGKLLIISDTQSPYKSLLEYNYNLILQRRSNQIPAVASTEVALNYSRSNMYVRLYGMRGITFKISHAGQCVCWFVSGDIIQKAFEDFRAVTEAGRALSISKMCLRGLTD